MTWTKRAGVRALACMLSWTAAACADAHLGDRPTAETSPGRSEPAADPQPLLLLESADGTRLQVMRGDQPLAELPAFASWEGYRDPGSSQLVANREYALITHAVSRPYTYLPDPASGDPDRPPPGSSVQRMMLVRRADLQVLWRRTSDWQAEAYPPQLAADGRVVVGTRAPHSFERDMRVIERDGGTRTVEGVFPLGAPGADGWLPVEEGDGDGTGPRFGFMQLDSEERVAIREPLQGTVESGPFYFAVPTAVPDGSLEYLSLRDGELALVHERHDRLQRVPLGRSPLGGARIWPADSGWMIDAAGVDGSEQPWLWVDRATRTARAIERPALGDKLLFAGVASGDWFSFRSSERNAVAGWLNPATSQWKAAPELPAGMQELATEYCVSPAQLLRDERVLVALRDERFGAVYAADGAGGFERISLPIRDAVQAEVTQIGDTLQVHAVARQYTYCPEPSWREPEPGEDEPARVLRGGQSELIRGDRSLVVEQYAGSSVHPSGRYAAVYAQEDTVLHDLELGSSVALADSSHVVGWFE